MNCQSHEAIRLLNRMFGIQDGCSNGTVEKIVDNIIKAAVIEMKETHKVIRECQCCEQNGDATCAYQLMRDAAIKERDEWKRRAGNAEYELDRQKNLIRPLLNVTKPEPSRLEIAAGIMQGFAANPDESPNYKDSVHFYAAAALQAADALITALREKEESK